MASKTPSEGPAPKDKPARAVQGDDEMTRAIATLQSMGFGAASAMGTAWIETFADLGSEITTFVAERIQEDVKTQHEILHCRDIAALHEIQARFVQKAIDQYTAETGKLVEIGQKMFTVPPRDD